MSNYKVGDKFEIVIGSEFVDENNNRLYRIKGFNSLVFDENGLIKLKKAQDIQNEIDIAYLKGYVQGQKDARKLQNVKKPKTVKASELAVDTKVVCSDIPEVVADDFNTKHFAALCRGKLYAFDNGKSEKNHDHIVYWKYMTLEDGTVVLPE